MEKFASVPQLNQNILVTQIFYNDPHVILQQFDKI